MNKRLYGFLSVVLLAWTSTAIHAATLDNFVLTSGADVTTFSLPASPAVTGQCSITGQCFFVIDSVPVVLDNTATTADIIFYSSGYSGGFTIYQTPPFNSGILIAQVGPQLYSGSASTPTFLLGNFNFSNYTMSGLPEYSENFNLTISPASAPTPEPSSLLLLTAAGLAGIAFAWRRRFTAGSPLFKGQPS